MLRVSLFKLHLHNTICRCMVYFHFIFIHFFVSEKKTQFGKFLVPLWVLGFDRTKQNKKNILDTIASSWGTTDWLFKRREQFKSIQWTLLVNTAKMATNMNDLHAFCTVFFFTNTELPLPVKVAFSLTLCQTELFHLCLLFRLICISDSSGFVAPYSNETNRMLCDRLCLECMHTTKHYT